MRIATRMTKEAMKDSVEILEGVQVSYADGIMTMKGPKGEISKRIEFPSIKIEVAENKVNFVAETPTKREKMMIGTFKAHLKNMMKGVTEGYVYKLKICAGHFPMNVTVNKEKFEVKNFLGEKVPRTTKIKKNATVKVEGDVVVVEAIDKETAGQTAADIEQLTVVRNKDRRIFQDGIFITQKGDKLIG